VTGVIDYFAAQQSLTDVTLLRAVTAGNVPVGTNPQNEATSVTDGICAKSISDSSMRCFNSSMAGKISVLVFVLVAASGFAFAADQTLQPKSNRNPCNLSEEDAAGLNGDLSTDIHTLHNYIATIARILKEEKFEELDCLADRARSAKERFPGGIWKIHILYEGLDLPVQYPTHATHEDWAILLQRLQRWETARPKSITAPVALAWAYIGYAWDARGNGMGDTVSGNGWKLFAERNSEAKRILDKAATLPTKCPEWYTAAQEIAQNQGWPTAQARVIYDEAIKFEPGYYYYARNLANYLLPKWSGTPGDTEKFTQEAADRIGGERGDILYFQVATFVICGCDEDPHLSMERIERGFEASEKQYGVSLLNLNLIASLASKYRDNDAIIVDKVLTRIGEQWDEQTWTKKEDFDRTKQWAATWAPRMAETLAMETSAQANMHTPEGSRYKLSFEKTYTELVQQCVRTDGATQTEWKGKFKTFTQVGAKGTIENLAIYAMTPVTMCVRRKLGLAWRDKSPVFAPPPQGPYWIALELDWADFVPVAAK
jgi:hypothetical protein